MLPALRGGLILLLFILAPLSPCPLAGERKIDETGRFAIYIEGSYAGYENYSISAGPDGRIVAAAESELVTNDGLEQTRLAYEAKMLLDEKRMVPLSYSYRFKGEGRDSIDVNFTDGHVTRRLMRGGRLNVKERKTNRELILVDYNVFSHYILLLEKYDRSKKGEQTFYNYLPLIAEELPTSVIYKGEFPLTINDKEIVVRNFVVDFQGLYSVDLLADRDGRIVKITIPGKNIEVYREDLAPPR